MRTVRKAKGRTSTTRRANARGDAQKAKIYAWEDSHPYFSKNTLSPDECNNLVCMACDMYNISPPEVLVHYRRELSYSQGDVISLQGVGKNGYASGGLNAATVLHEAAHHIQSYLYPHSTDHGYRFAGLYRTLLFHFDVLPIQVIRDEWAQFDIRWRR